MLDERLELVGGVEIATDVEKRIKKVGVKGLDTARAKELGVWNRISYLLCTIHSSIMAAYRIYGNVSYLMDELNARRNEIAREMNAFEKSYDRFIRFWSDYYAKGEAGVEMNEETEVLYRQIMHWAQLPEAWELGGEQRTKESDDIAIKIKRDNDRDLYFHKCTVETELTDEPKESWCVTKYNEKTKQQTTVNVDMDKGSAMMVAKRLSSEDKDSIYTASLVREVVERRIDVMPYKAYKNNATIGKVKNLL